MRTSRKILLGPPLVLVLAAGGIAVWVWEPWNPIRESACRHITKGMTWDQVEAVLGKPTTGLRGEYPRNIRGIGTGPETGKAEWLANGDKIVVTFAIRPPDWSADTRSYRMRGRKRIVLLDRGDVAGGVAAVEFIPTDQPAFRQGICDWLSW